MSSEIERLVAAINEHPDHLHGDRTPAVDALVAHGLPALPHILPLLESEDQLTRLRAQRVLEGVTHAWAQAHATARPLTHADTRAWHQLWADNGAYDWQAPPAARHEAVGRWRTWLQGRTGPQPAP